MMLRALTVAGSDPCGGAGLQLDLKVFHARGVYGAAVPTAITVQGFGGVRSVRALEGPLVEAQLETVLEEPGILAVKTGMLGNAAVVRAVGRVLQRFPSVPLVLDPVMVSSSGHRLLDDEGVWALTESLLGRCTLITPNADEATVLCRMPVRDVEEAQSAAMAIQALGARAVLIKGGHLQDEECVDVLFDGEQFHLLTGPRLALGRSHGTGCMVSALITAHLALGLPLHEAVAGARTLVQRALVGAQEGPGGVQVPDVFQLTVE